MIQEKNIQHYREMSVTLCKGCDVETNNANYCALCVKAKYKKLIENGYTPEMLANWYVTNVEEVEIDEKRNRALKKMGVENPMRALA